MIYFLIITKIIIIEIVKIGILSSLLQEKKNHYYHSVICGENGIRKESELEAKVLL